MPYTEYAIRMAYFFKLYGIRMAYSHAVWHTLCMAYCMAYCMAVQIANRKSCHTLDLASVGKQTSCNSKDSIAVVVPEFTEDCNMVAR